MDYVEPLSISEEGPPSLPSDFFKEVVSSVCWVVDITVILER